MCLIKIWVVSLKISCLIFILYYNNKDKIQNFIFNIYEWNNYIYAISQRIILSIQFPYQTTSYCQHPIN